MQQNAPYHATPNPIHKYIPIIIHPPPRLPQEPPSQPPLSRNIEPKTPHTTPILLHRPLTRLLRIRRVAKKHAFVPRCFFIFAYAAGLLWMGGQYMYGS